jgi:spore coat-associated protein N
MAARTDAVTADTRRRRRRRRLLILLLIGLSALPSVATSYISISLFSERATLPNDAWAPIPIDVRAEPDMLMQVTGMLPGDTHSGELRVANVGVDPLRYSLVSATTDPDGRGLRDALHATIRDEGSDCAAFNGTLLYDGPLVGAGFGNPASGQHDGDRLLSGGTDDMLCVRVALPPTAGNHYQRSATAATFTVIAEHAAGFQ